MKIKEIATLSFSRVFEIFASQQWSPVLAQINSTIICGFGCFLYKWFVGKLLKIQQIDNMVVRLWKALILSKIVIFQIKTISFKIYVVLVIIKTYVVNINVNVFFFHLRSKCLACRDSDKKFLRQIRL